MNSAGVSKINFFVDTHYREDHYGGIDDLINLGVTVLEILERRDKMFLPASKLAEQYIFRGLYRPVSSPRVNATKTHHRFCGHGSRCRAGQSMV